MVSIVKKKEKRITERDLKILKFIGCEMGFALTSHVTIQYFTNSKVASRRLKVLREKGLLYHVERPSNKAGRSEYAFYLSEKGKKLITDKKDIHKVALKELSHTLLINEFVMSIRKELKGTNFNFEYVKDLQLKEASQFESYLDDNGHFLKVMYPDIIFCISNNENKKVLFFVEVERGTISIDSNTTTSITEKIEVMSEYFDHYVYKYFNEVFDYDFQGFRYLIVTSGNISRVKKIRECVSRLDQDLGFVWLTSTNSINEKGVLKNVWQTANKNDDKKYSIL